MTKTKFMARSVALALAAAAGGLPLTAQAQTAPDSAPLPAAKKPSPGVWSMSAGVSYSEGRYGDIADTKVISAPVSLKYRRGNWRFKLSVPYVRLTGPGALVQTPEGRDSGATADDFVDLSALSSGNGGSSASSGNSGSGNSGSGTSGSGSSGSGTSGSGSSGGSGNSGSGSSGSGGSGSGGSGNSGSGGSGSGGSGSSGSGSSGSGGSGSGGSGNSGSGSGGSGSGGSGSSGSGSSGSGSSASSGTASSGGTLGGGAVATPAGGATTTLVNNRRSGLGDVTAALTYSFDFGNGFYADATGKVKLPTARRSNRLGTGKVDFTASVDLSKDIGAASIYLSGRRRFTGRPAGSAIRSVWGAGGGASIRASRSISLGADYDWQQSSFAGGQGSSEVTGWMYLRLTNRLGMTLYAGTGLNDASADFLGGATMTVRF